MDISLERRSSAVTLSDMEIFLFPELMFSLVLANMMSPRIWAWRDDPWFKGLEKMKPYRRITRLKQFIMNHYEFNLDLDTWGLTSQPREIARFASVIDPALLKQSNALFGYEGDKYYFDIDIRTHFGLDKYGSHVIPYWKTETVEAMDAFCFRDGYRIGAGECVSLAALYAAALFVVAKIPLNDIYLMATPLHSQNFVDVDDGILTNNRRLVTKNMWFNGTALSAQARRALENERVTIVTHASGYIHTMYPEATIDAAVYEHFTHRLASYLTTGIDEQILGNFLRHKRNLQKCFQLRWPLHGADRYVNAERVFAYEHGSPYMVNDNTRGKLMAEIEMSEFMPAPAPRRIILNDLEAFLKKNQIDIDSREDIDSLKAQFACDCLDAQKAIDELIEFCHVTPRLPHASQKVFNREQAPLGIEPDMNRDQIMQCIAAVRDRNQVADLAFYAYRDLTRTSWQPFMIAAIQRNPVSATAASDMTDAQVMAHIETLATESIYDGPGRLAQPDEVWNFGRGDGVEKAVLTANIMYARHPQATIEIHIAPDSARVVVDDRSYGFPSAKALPVQIWKIDANIVGQPVAQAIKTT